MRRSREVNLTLLASLAVTLTACTPEHKDCVDAQGRILPDSACRAPVGGAHYIYGGSSGGHVGDYVLGGSTSSSILRGGFGAHGASGDAGGE
jgi:hypothetical protein